jgi:hypothetical protein
MTEDALVRPGIQSAVINININCNEWLEQSGAEVSASPEQGHDRVPMFERMITM